MQKVKRNAKDHSRTRKETIKNALGDQMARPSQRLKRLATNNRNHIFVVSHKKSTNNSGWDSKEHRYNQKNKYCCRGVLIKRMAKYKHREIIKYHRKKTQHYNSGENKNHNNRDTILSNGKKGCGKVNDGRN